MFKSFNRLNSGVGPGPYDLLQFYANKKPVLPRSASDLNPANPRLKELVQQYEEFGFPPCGSWGKGELNFPYFRGDNDYVWQLRYFEDDFEDRMYHYAEYVQNQDSLSILGLCREDLLFGAFGIKFRGQVVSRDLLDSVIQINWACHAIDELSLERATVLDIGAGYGRLAHRVSEAFVGRWKSLSADGIAYSTFLSEWYLRYREAANSSVISLPNLRESLRVEQPLVAFNCHSFSEIPALGVAWWLNEIEVAAIRHLIIVTNERSKQFLSSESDSRRVDLLQMFAERGWAVEKQEPVVDDEYLRKKSNVHNWFLYLRREF